MMSLYPNDYYDDLTQTSADHYDYAKYLGGNVSSLGAQVEER